MALPWHMLQVFTGAKAFGDNPILGSRRLNRRGLHVARVAAAARMAARRRRRLARSILAADRTAFDRDGFVARRDFLHPAVFERLRAEALAFAAPAREMRQGNTVTRRIAVDPAFLKAVPAARALLDDPQWRGLTRYAASHGAEPLIYVQTILTGLCDGDDDPQTVLHADTFHASAKAWLFLTDVAEDEGPFRYVPGSHRATPERLAWERTQSLRAKDGLDRLSARGSLRISDEELPTLGLPPARAFAVPANTLIVADTYGFHARGRAARPGVRIEIWAYTRRNPFVPWSGFDPTGVRGIAERRIGAMWWLRDRLERFVGQPWAKAGRKRPGDMNLSL